MTDHRLNVTAGLGMSSATSTGSEGGGSAASLRPLSEGVLHAAGLHGGPDASGGVRDLRAEVPGAFDIDPHTLPSDEPHVRLMKLEHQTGGVVERRVMAQGDVVLRLIHGDGDVTTARAADTKAALELLITKMGGLK